MLSFKHTRINESIPLNIIEQLPKYLADVFTNFMIMAAYIFRLVILGRFQLSSSQATLDTLHIPSQRQRRGGIVALENVNANIIH